MTCIFLICYFHGLWPFEPTELFFISEIQYNNLLYTQKFILKMQKKTFELFSITENTV